MKKLAKIFSILLLLNFLSNSKADLLGDLLGGLTGGLLGGVGNTLNQLLDHLKSLLNGILDLTQQELLKLVDVLNLLKSMGIEVTDEKLKLTAQNVAIINGRTNGIWEAKLGFFSLLPDEDQKKLCGVFDIEIENIAGRDTSVAGMSRVTRNPLPETRNPDFFSTRNPKPDPRNFRKPDPKPDIFLGVLLQKGKIFGSLAFQNSQNFRLRRWKMKKSSGLVFQNSQNFRLRRWKMKKSSGLVFQNSQNFLCGDTKCC
uniref:Uncharacterized protein n=1 Tax=Meloidogyne enterolobii TaxID=390850 RepID=A0A6V7VNJ2_MELEN|nr:unnamed protein product [Meloidogyne enterolobii]